MHTKRAYVQRLRKCVAFLLIDAVCVAGAMALAHFMTSDVVVQPQNHGLWHGLNALSVLVSFAVCGLYGMPYHTAGISEAIRILVALGLNLVFNLIFVPLSGSVHFLPVTLYFCFFCAAAMLSRFSFRLARAARKSYIRMTAGGGADLPQNVEINDLLERDPVVLNSAEVRTLICGKRVLVTGGGGSIGSELCRQIAAQEPAELIILDIYENNAYDTEMELRQRYPQLNLRVLIGSVRDEKRVRDVFEATRPQLVFHAAAHKHVPLMEQSPNEAVKNNVFGTYNVAKAAGECGVDRFVLISTDKAVNPTNVMGATKRICEMIMQYFSCHSTHTEYAAVRFGNVLGSNGSVIPLFQKQIAAGGPVRVTHKDIIRYFMTIPEAVALVLQAGTFAKGGEIFVLDMGEPVKILTLAENLIRLSGFQPYTDIPIVFTGLRPGEKLYEELLMAEEGMKSTANDRIRIGCPILFDETELLATLQELREQMGDDANDLRPLIRRLVPTFRDAASNDHIEGVTHDGT